LFAREAADIAAAGLGATWDDFRHSLAGLRRAGVCVTRGEIDPGRVGIAAPIFDRDHAILGSLSFVLPKAYAEETLVGRIAPLTIAGAREIERGMNSATASNQPSSARIKIAT
jgi:DNA-binding IclR family transcriptional regulator